MEADTVEEESESQEPRPRPASIEEILQDVEIEDLDSSVVLPEQSALASADEVIASVAEGSEQPASSEPRPLTTIDEAKDSQLSASSTGVAASSSSSAAVSSSSGAAASSRSSIAGLNASCVDEASFHRRVENMLQDVRARLSAEHDKVVMALRSQNQELRRLLSENDIEMPPEVPLPDLLPDYLDRCERQGQGRRFSMAREPSSPRRASMAKESNDGDSFQVRRETRKSELWTGGAPRKATFSALKDDHPNGPGSSLIERRQSLAARRQSQFNPKTLKSAKTMPSQRLDGPGVRISSMSTTSLSPRGPGSVTLGTPSSPVRKRSLFRAENDLNIEHLRHARSVSPMPPSYGSSSSSTGPVQVGGSSARPRGRMSVQLLLPGEEPGPQRSASARPADTKEKAPGLRLSGAPDLLIAAEPPPITLAQRLSGRAQTDNSTASSKSLSLLMNAGKSPVPSPRASPNPSPRCSRNEVAPGPSDDTGSAKERANSGPRSARPSAAATTEDTTKRMSAGSACGAAARAKAAIVRAAANGERRSSGISTTSSLASDPDAKDGEPKKSSIVYNAWTGEATPRERASEDSTDIKTIRVGSPLEDGKTHAAESEEAALERGRREAFVPCGILEKMLNTNDVSLGPSNQQKSKEEDDVQDLVSPLSNGAATTVTSGAKSLWRRGIQRASVLASVTSQKRLRFGAKNPPAPVPERSVVQRTSADSALSSFSAPRSSIASSASSRRNSGQAPHRASVSLEDGMGEMFEYEDEEEDDEFDDEEEDEMQHYWLHPVWMEWNARGKHTTRKTATAGNVLQQQLFIMDAEQKDDMACDLLVGGDSRIGELMEPFMIHPNSFMRMLWDMLGCVLFCWDAVVIPLQFFNPPKAVFLTVMSWIVRVYWTIDIFVSCLTGNLLINGNVDMRPEAVVKRYAMGWLGFDFLVVMLDWSELYGGLDEFAIARVGKMIKSVRMLRMFRVLKLMRTVKLPETIRNWTYYFHSERLTILVGIFRIMVAIVWVTHFFACFWYGIGRPTGEEDAGRDMDNWVDRYGYARADLDYLYTTSFHWSLTQFTGSMDVYPTNTVERVFSIIALLFAFVVSAFAVSSITTSMTRLEIITTQQSTQFAKLRQYLLANGISKMLSLRIQRSANREVEEAKLRASEADVELLQLVSEPLRVELHYELNSPALMVHPFFYCYDQAYSAAMRQLCHTAIERKSFHRGDMLFSDGEMPEDGKMYFLLNGRLLYLQDESNPKTVLPGHWACEAALWTQWHYHGSMRSITDTHLALLDAAKFQKITCGFITRDANPIHYGKEFLKHLNCTPKAYMTDLVDPLGLDLGELASKVLAVAQPNSIFSKIRALGSTHSNNGIEMMGPGGLVHKQLSTRSANGSILQRAFGSRGSTASTGIAPMSSNQLMPPGAARASGRRFSLSVLPSQVGPSLSATKLPELSKAMNGERKRSL